MRVRVAILCAQVLAASSAVAEELSPGQARAFVVGKLFAYSCFDGTAALPAGTITADGNSICAHLSGLPIEPCFKVRRIDDQSFRGSIAGFDFAYCDFYQRQPRAQLMSRFPH
jgi:hypothetical protein